MERDARRGPGGPRTPRRVGRAPFSGIGPQPFSLAVDVDDALLPLPPVGDDRDSWTAIVIGELEDWRAVDEGPQPSERDEAAST